ncbi:MAG: PQQ-dependent sugar dehydrogenase [Burkholderiaceae bacterium]
MTQQVSSPARRRLSWRLAAIAIPLAGLALTLRAGDDLAQPPSPDDPKIVEVATGLEHPWSLAFLPDGRMLVTERPGRMRWIGADGKLSAPLTGVPAVQAAGQGGLLDVVPSPRFATDQTIFFTFSEPAGADGAPTTETPAPLSRTALARARVTPTGLDEVRVLYRQQPAVGGQLHYGSRIVFGRDGNLWVGLGERYSQRDKAQTLDNSLGKVIRLTPEGKPPADNPFVGRPGALPEIWSLGHRNIQGAALNPATGELWTLEHGAKGGDEVNRDLPGRNYGWPLITWGTDYDGSKIGEGTTREGLEQPLHYWVPSISPSGATFYTGDKFPQWRGSLLVGGLSANLLVRLTVDGNRVTGEQRLLQNLSPRVRDVRQGPDGYVYLLTDAPDGKLLKLIPRETP